MSEVQDGKSRYHGDVVLRALPYVSMAGLVTILAVGALAFEEVQTPLLLVSLAFLLAAPVGLVSHLALTKELGASEKGLWRRAGPCQSP